MRRPAIMSLACSVVAAATLCACGGGGGRVGDRARASGPPEAPISVKAGVAAWERLQPERLRFRALTRLDEGARGDPRITCHIELLDSFGHDTKALGVLRVELYRPRGVTGEGGESQELVWTIDLTNPDVNAAHYDGLVTRSYVVNLGDLPPWVDAWRAGAGPEPWLTLRGYFSFADLRGRERSLQGTFRLQR